MAVSKAKILDTLLEDGKMIMHEHDRSVLTCAEVMDELKWLFANAERLSKRS